eukprot:scaffold4269_cov75-Phaeocystis_antarctica.AAC.4
MRPSLYNKLKPALAVSFGTPGALSRRFGQPASRCDSRGGGAHTALTARQPRPAGTRADAAPRASA